jgi:hypothetical protein
MTARRLCIRRRLDGPNGSYLNLDAGAAVPTTTPSSSTHTWQPAANVPFSSEFFNNLLGDAGNLSAEAWRRLRR